MLISARARIILVFDLKTILWAVWWTVLCQDIVTILNNTFAHFLLADLYHEEHCYESLFASGYVTKKL